MTGSNLPPGVTEGMIPGNRPEDIALDRALEEYHRVYHANYPQGGDAGDHDNAVSEAVIAVMSMAYEQGFDDGKAEAQIDELQRQEASYVDPYNAPAYERLDAIRGLTNEVAKRLDAHAHMARLEARHDEETPHE